MTIADCRLEEVGLIPPRSAHLSGDRRQRMRGERWDQGWTERLWDWAALSLLIRAAPPAVAPYLAADWLCDETSQPHALHASSSTIVNRQSNLSLPSRSLAASCPGGLPRQSAAATGSARRRMAVQNSSHLHPIRRGKWADRGGIGPTVFPGAAATVLPI